VREVKIEPPAEIGMHEGLCYALFLPKRELLGGVVILHGAGSCKESHYDFARVLRAGGLAALPFDMRGHGDSEGELDERALEDVGAMVALLRAACAENLAIGLRGSSMGGYLALVTAARVQAAAVVAICPAPAHGLVHGLKHKRFTFKADEPALAGVLRAHDDLDAVAGVHAPLLLLHAEGDDQVPVEHSRDLDAAAPNSRLIVVPGGHHRSIQHDAELQADAMRFLRRHLREA
jgi:pimeloyl-ACP methyl ester carboxylesterase